MSQYDEFNDPDGIGADAAYHAQRDLDPLFPDPADRQAEEEAERHQAMLSECDHQIVHDGRCEFCGRKVEDPRVTDELARQEREADDLHEAHGGPYTIEFSVPGVVDQHLVHDTECLRELPGLVDAWSAGERRKIGFGYRWTVQLMPEQHQHIIGYLEAKLGAEESLAGGAGDGVDYSLIAALRKLVRA